MTRDIIRTQGQLRQAVQNLFDLDLPFALDVDRNVTTGRVPREQDRVQNRLASDNSEPSTGPAYLNDEDRERDRQFHAILNNLWRHSGTENVSPGAIAFGNLLANINANENLPDVERRRVEHNPPPSGAEVNSISEIFQTPGSYYIFNDGDQTFAVSEGSIVDGLENFAVLSRQLQLNLLSSLEGSMSGLGIWNQNLGDVLLRIFSDTLDHMILGARETEDEPCLISMGLSNINNSNQSVNSGEFEDTPQNRIAIIRSLIDDMMLSMNRYTRLDSSFRSNVLLL